MIRTRTFVRVWQISTIAWIIIFVVLELVYEPEYWFGGIICGLIFGVMTAIFTGWTSNVIDAVKKLGWRAFLITAPPKPRKPSLIYRILEKIDNLFFD